MPDGESILFTSIPRRFSNDNTHLVDQMSMIVKTALPGKKHLVVG